MRCPQCGERDTRVVDSRDLDDSATIRRRRECMTCTMRFTTYERIEAARLIVVKRDGSRQEFDRERLMTGLRKALTRRPVPDGAAEAAADRIEAELRAEGMTEVPSSRVGALAMERAARPRPDRLHPLRERLPELRGPRGPQARGRHALRGEGRREPRRVSVLSDRDIRAALEAGSVRIDPYDAAGSPAIVGRPAPRPLVPGVPQQPLPVHRRPRAAAGPDRAIDRGGRRGVHPPPGRVRPGPDPGVGRAARRPRGQARREELAREAGAADPLDGRLRRPGLEGQPDARAVQRRQPADRAVPRHAHRPDLVLPHVVAGRAAVRLARAAARATRARRSRPRRPITGTSTGSASRWR